MKNKVAILIFLGTILFGCDVFQTRNPEEPNSNGNTYIPATSPDILFNNLVNSFKEKVIENYIATIVDNATLEKKYIFVPAPGALSKFQGLSDWTINSERLYFTNLISFAGKGQIIVQLFNRSGNVQGDSATFSFDYVVNLPFEENTFEGSARFTLFLDNRNFWFITKWEDFEKAGFQSWSEIKGKYN